MCGIAGVFEYGTASGQVSSDVVVAMRDTLIHRGPDGEGLYLSEDRRVGLGHRRLAIVDIAGGAQPMTGRDGSVLVFNGEIYNYPAIRRQLEADGVQFRTTCDTEVILHLYERFGLTCVDHLEGMFAFALWDPNLKRMCFARDPIGEKPLYWAERGGRLIFGSEIKAILEHPSVTAEVDQSQIGPYLANLVTPGPHTLFKGISKLRPGTIMTCDSTGIEQKPFTPLPRSRDLREVPVAEAAATAVGLLETSLNDRLMADVPVGVLLSGGVDSSALVALLRDRGQDMATFSVGYGAGDPGDERGEARKVAKHFGTDHHEIEIGEREAVGFLADLIHHQDEPLADPVCIPLNFVCRLAADNGVKVVLAGEGADEVFWGYANYRQLLRVWPAIQAIGAMPGPLARAASSAVGSRIGMSGESVAMAINGGRPLAAHSFLWNSVSLRKHLIEDQIPTDIGWERSGLSREEGSRDRFMFDTQEYEFAVRLPELLLMRIDRFSMGNSIEARAPFLAPELVNYMYGQSLASKMNGNESKIALRAGLRGVLPDWVLDRRKQGFGAPVRKWFDSELGRLFELTAREETLGRYFDLQSLRKMLADGGAGFGLWPILNFGLWHMKWIEGRDLGDLLGQSTR